MNGEGRIRTDGGLAPTLVFKTQALSSPDKASAGLGKDGWTSSGPFYALDTEPLVCRAHGSSAR